jgi:hypothetical protein
MALNSSGPLSFGGSTVGQSINLELGVSATAQASINSTAFRDLAGVPSGAISINNFYGKSSVTYWMRTLGATGYNTDGFSITTDSSNNVYQLGFVNSPGGSGAFLGKYDTAGAVTFQKRYKKVGVGDPTFYGVEMASDGGFYAGVQLQSNNTANDIAVVKFDSSGNIVWQQYLFGSDGAQDFIGRQIAIDSSENIYVVGLSDQSGAYRGVLQKRDSSGTLQYQRQFAPNGSSYSLFYAVAVSGNSVYMAGNAAFSFGGVQAVLFKYSQSANSVVWDKSLGTSNTEEWVSCQVDSSENIYLLGNTDTNLGIMSFLIAKYNSSGTLQWQRKLGTGSTNQTVPGQLALDSSNNVYVVGWNAGNKIQIAKYDSSGAIQWQRSISNTSGGVARAMTGRDISIRGDVMYISGEVTESTGGSFFLPIKLPTDGSLTGTYVVGIFTLVYAASSITDEAGSATENTVPHAQTNTSFTNADPGYSVFTTSLTGSLTPVP